MSILKRINWYKAAGFLAILISAAISICVAGYVVYWAWQIARAV